MKQRTRVVAIVFVAAWGTALAQTPDAGTPEPSLRPFNPEELATPPPEWRTPPPPPPTSPRPPPEQQIVPSPPAANATPATPAPVAATQGKPKFDSYSWNFWLIDPLAMAAMAYGVYGHSDGALFYGTLAYLLNGPLIHVLFHGRLAHGGFSLLYRLGMPFVSLLALSSFFSASKCETASCTRNQIVAMAGLGMIVAWGWDLAAADEAGPPESVKMTATFGTTGRGTLTAGFGLQF